MTFYNGRFTSMDWFLFNLYSDTKLSPFLMKSALNSFFFKKSSLIIPLIRKSNKLTTFALIFHINLIIIEA